MLQPWRPGGGWRGGAADPGPGGQPRAGRADRAVPLPRRHHRPHSPHAPGVFCIVLYICILHSASSRASGCGSTRSCRRAAPGTTGTGGWRSAAWRWVAARQGRCTAHAQVADTGVYICVARLGDAVTTARANLTVTTSPPVGINQPDPRSVAI